MLIIACPKCSRQYDATGLQAGSEVRCYCDELFSVRWPDKLSATALTCTHCGGAVGVTDEACPYCAARISEEDRRKTTLCPGCFTRIEDDSKHCRSCALVIQPQCLSPLPADRNCPRCTGKLRVRSLGSVDVTECSDCLGFWLTPDAFQGVTSSAKAQSGETEHLVTGNGAQERVQQPDEMRYIPCLKCGELMQRRQYTQNNHMSGTIIDLCRGHGVWLDHAEIESILEFLATAPTQHASSNQIDPGLLIAADEIRTGADRSGLNALGMRSRRSTENPIIDFLVNLLFGF